ncbi:unnamed protein product [Notodromas monacha]|uniref:C2H2-type domain-containing protein n=1 Tax=Notodromas monacha TaxID=399045 RepID=A0A7R9BVJ9_9CRUS|nr:unnamed protein product [Notodromas monacha]CAG0920916.1 unnamed protein product [Notodromas monacha]
MSDTVLVHELDLVTLIDSKNCERAFELFRESHEGNDGPWKLVLYSSSDEALLPVESEPKESAAEKAVVEPLSKGSKGKVKCSSCSKTFSRHVDLWRHVRTKHKEPSHLLDVFSHVITKHLEDEVFKCKLCGKEFEKSEQIKCRRFPYFRQDHLLKHSKKETKEIPAKPVVDYKKRQEIRVARKKFNAIFSHKKRGRKKGKRLDQDVDTAEALSIPAKASSICPICRKVFKKGSLMARHMRCHTGERPFRCPKCDKGFAQKTCLGRHMRLHEKEKPFACLFCPYRAAMKANLKLHIRRLHWDQLGDRKLGALASSRTPEAGGEIRCPLCPCVFQRRGCLKVHLKKIHDFVEGPKEDCVQAKDADIIQEDKSRGEVFDAVVPPSANVENSDVLEQNSTSNASPISLIFIEPTNLISSAHEIFLIKMYLLGTLVEQSEAEDTSMEAEVAKDPKPTVKQAKNFACHACPASYKRLAHLKEHEKEKHGTSSIPCETCGRRFWTKRLLLSHERVHVIGGLHECELCGKTFRYKNGVKRHVQAQHGDKRFSCSFCGKKFGFSNSCKRHMETACPNAPASITGVQEAEVEEHDENPMEPAAFSLDLLGQYNLLSQRQLIGPLGGLELNLWCCTKVVENEAGEYSLILPSQPVLPPHPPASLPPPPPLPSSTSAAEPVNLPVVEPVRVSAPERTQQQQSASNHSVCQVCHKSFKKRADFQRHLRVHTGERPFGCDLCEKKFSTSYALTSHKQQVHFPVKRVECHVCNKMFANRSARNLHLRLHTGDKPFVCNVCGAAFRTSGHLSSHKRNHSKTGKEVLVVPVLPTSTSSFQTMHRGDFLNTSADLPSCVQQQSGLDLDSALSSLVASFDNADVLGLDNNGFGYVTRKKTSSSPNAFRFSTAVHMQGQVTIFGWLDDRNLMIQSFGTYESLVLMGFPRIMVAKESKMALILESPSRNIMGYVLLLMVAVCSVILSMHCCVIFRE